VLEQLYAPIGWTTPITRCGLQSTYEFIRNVAENACISENVIVFAMNYFDKIKPSLTRKFKETTIAAYAIYESLNTFEAPRLAEEIEFYTGVPLDEIWEVECNLEIETQIPDPKHYVHRYCSLLNICYSDQLIIRDTVECLNTEIPIGNLRCNCLVAVVIYLFCLEKMKPITLKKICDTCYISATSIHRVIRQFKEVIPEIKEHKPIFWILKHVQKIVEL